MDFEHESSSASSLRRQSSAISDDSTLHTAATWTATTSEEGGSARVDSKETAVNPLSTDRGALDTLDEQLDPLDEHSGTLHDESVPFPVLRRVAGPDMSLADSTNAPSSSSPAKTGSLTGDIVSPSPIHPAAFVRVSRFIELFDYAETLPSAVGRLVYVPHPRFHTLAPAFEIFPRTSTDTPSSPGRILAPSQPVDDDLPVVPAASLALAAPPLVDSPQPLSPSSSPPPPPPPRSPFRRPSKKVKSSVTTSIEQTLEEAESVSKVQQPTVEREQRVPPPIDTTNVRPHSTTLNSAAALAELYLVENQTPIRTSQSHASTSQAPAPSLPREAELPVLGDVPSSSNGRRKRFSFGVGEREQKRQATSQSMEAAASSSSSPRKPSVASSVFGRARLRGSSRVTSPELSESEAEMEGVESDGRPVRRSSVTRFSIALHNRLTGHQRSSSPGRPSAEFVTSPLASSPPLEPPPAIPIRSSRRPSATNSPAPSVRSPKPSVVSDGASYRSSGRRRQPPHWSHFISTGTADSASTKPPSMRQVFSGEPSHPHHSPAPPSTPLRWYSSPSPSLTPPPSRFHPGPHRPVSVLSGSRAPSVMSGSGTGRGTPISRPYPPSIRSGSGHGTPVASSIRSGTGTAVAGRRSPRTSGARTPRSTAARARTTSSTGRPGLGTRKLSKASDTQVLREWEERRAVEMSRPKGFVWRLFAHADRGTRAS